MLANFAMFLGNGNLLEIYDYRNEKLDILFQKLIFANGCNIYGIQMISTTNGKVFNKFNLN
jgi:hypothetical protein